MVVLFLHGENSQIPINNIEKLVELISLISNYILETQNKIIFLEKTRERDKMLLR